MAIKSLNFIRSRIELDRLNEKTIVGMSHAKTMCGLEVFCDSVLIEYLIGNLRDLVVGEIHLPSEIHQDHTYVLLNLWNDLSHITNTHIIDITHSKAERTIDEFIETMAHRDLNNNSFSSNNIDILNRITSEVQVPDGHTIVGCVNFFTGDDFHRNFGSINTVVAIQRFVEYPITLTDSDESNYAVVIETSCSGSNVIDVLSSSAFETALNQMLETNHYDSINVDGIILYRLRYIGDMKRIKILHYGQIINFVVDRDFLVGSWLPEKHYAAS